MSYNKYISAKEIVAQLLIDYAIEKTDMVYRMYEWIENALEIMELADYYTWQTVPLTIEEYKAVLPCEPKYIHSVWVGARGEKVNNIHNLCKLTIRNNPLIGKEIKDLVAGDQYGTIQGRVVHTTFREGKILVVYKGIPLDCDGLPQVPDSAKLKEALPYYIIYRMSLSGYKHPLIDFSTAKQLWEYHYPQGANDVNWMDEQEYQEFSDMWNNPILGDMANNFYMH